MSEASSEVIQMLAKERGLSQDRIKPSSRLLQDLGMDGDDAVDFFISLEERFGTDISALREKWGEHFGPEGFSCWNGLVIMPMAIIAGAGAGLLDLGFLGGAAIFIALLTAWILAIRKWGPPDKMEPITVAEVVAAVEAGAWPHR